MTTRLVINFIRQTDDRQTDKLTDRQTHDRQTEDRQTDRQTNFLLQFLSPRGPKRGEKKFQLNRKKNNFQDCSNIRPPELRTYKKYKYSLIPRGYTLVFM